MGNFFYLFLPIKETNDTQASCTHIHFPLSHMAFFSNHSCTFFNIHFLRALGAKEAIGVVRESLFSFLLLFLALSFFCIYRLGGWRMVQGENEVMIDDLG